MHLPVPCEGQKSLGGPSPVPQLTLTGLAGRRMAQQASAASCLACAAVRGHHQQAGPAFPEKVPAQQQ